MAVLFRENYLYTGNSAMATSGSESHNEPALAATSAKDRFPGRVAIVTGSASVGGE